MFTGIVNVNCIGNIATLTQICHYLHTVCDKGLMENVSLVFWGHYFMIRRAYGQKNEYDFEWIVSVKTTLLTSRQNRQKLTAAWEKKNSKPHAQVACR